MIERIQRAQLKRKVAQVLSSLSPDRRCIIERRFGLYDFDEETLESIGKSLGLSRERPPD